MIGDPRRVNLAWQGGGSHGAFTWGVLDALLEDGRLEFEGITGASAGAINAVLVASGWCKGLAAGQDSREAARIDARFLANARHTAGRILVASGDGRDQFQCIVAARNARDRFRTAAVERKQAGSAALQARAAAHDRRRRPMRAYGASSKYNTSPRFLTERFDVGRSAASEWLDAKFEFVGHASSVTISERFL